MRCIWIVAIAVAALWTGCKERPNVAVQQEKTRKAAEKHFEEKQQTKALSTNKANGSVTTRKRGCNTANVQSVVQPKRPDVIRCYRKLLGVQPRATGRLSVEIHIDKAGRAKFLGVKENSFQDEDFAQCVFDVLRPLDYPIPDTEPCVVIYPFSFMK